MFQKSVYFTSNFIFSNLKAKLKYEQQVYLHGIKYKK